MSVPDLSIHLSIHLSLYTFDTEGPPPGLYAPSSPGDDAQLIRDTLMCMMLTYQSIYLSLFTYDTEGPPPGLYAPSSPGDDA